MEIPNKNKHNIRNLPKELEQYGFFISKESHYRDMMPTYHSHPHYEILYISTGTKQLIISNNLLCNLDSDCIMLLKPHILHQTKSLSPNIQQRVLIHIRSDIINEFQKFASFHVTDCFNMPILKLSSYVRKMMNYFLSSLVSLSTDSPDYVAKGKVLLINLLTLLTDAYNEQKNSEISESTKLEQDYVAQISEYITNNFEKPITVADIAQKLHFSEIHVNRVFKKVMNTTLHKYLVSIRIIKAKEMLLEDNSSVNLTAERCGFNSPEAFSRAFKQHMGLPPSEYIKLKNIKRKEHQIEY